MPGTNYIYSDEDNAPMNEEAFQRPDRDCANCRHKVNGNCTQWDCNFSPKQHIVEEVQEWLAKTSNAASGTGAI